MRRGLLITLLVIAHSFLLAQSVLKVQTPFAMEDVPLAESLIALSNLTNVNISFSNELIPPNTLVTIDERYSTVDTILTKILLETPLSFKVEGNQIFICKRPPPVLKKITISGKIIDEATGEALIGANIFDPISKLGTTSNAYGYFSLTLLKNAVDLQFSYVGYESESHHVILKKDVSLDIRLKETEITPIVVKGRSSLSAEHNPNGAQRIDVEKLKSLPILGGEPDIYRDPTLNIQSGTDGVGGMLVRGGSVDQNLVMLDGVTVYNPVHAIGVFSIFNTDAINNATIYKGNFPARYGGRLSSVVDIRTKEGNKEEVSGEATIGLISVKGIFEGPLIKGKSSFFLSARRSITDLYAPAVSKRVKASNFENISLPHITARDGYSNYNFYDLNGKLNFNISDKDRLFLSVYGGGDRFFDETAVVRNQDVLVLVQPDVYENTEIKDTTQLSFDWGNKILAFRWNHIFKKKAFMNTTFNFSEYNFNSEERYISTGDYDSGRKDTIATFEKFRLDIKSETIKTDLEYIPSPVHHIRIGGEASRYRFQPGIFISDISLAGVPLYRDRAMIFDTTEIATQRAYETALYVEDEMTLFTKLSKKLTKSIKKNKVGVKALELKLNVGLRATSWHIDQNNFFSLQPRISASLLVKEQFKLQVGYSKMVQHLHFLTKSNLGLPSDVWVPSTANAPPEKSNQVTLGLSYDKKDKIGLSVDGYFKKMNNVVSLLRTDSLVLVEASDWENGIAVGNGTSYGVEFMIKKDYGQTRSWISYTLSKSERQFSEINKGKPFPFRHDRRHSLKLVLQHFFTTNFSVSASWIFESGARFSLPIHEYPQRLVSEGSTITVTVPSDTNSEITPAYHRLDVGLVYKIKNAWGTQVINVGGFNVYNRQNPIFVKYRPEDGNFVRVTLLPFLPSLSYSIKF